MYFTFSHFLATKHSQKKKKKNLVAIFSSHSPEPKLPNNSITTNKLSISLSSHNFFRNKQNLCTKLNFLRNQITEINKPRQT